MDSLGIKELRTMTASSHGKCHYCKGGKLESGATIAGHYGILWGHERCVFAAWKEHELILSASSAFRRLMHLEVRTNRRYWKGTAVFLSNAEMNARGTGNIDQIHKETRHVGKDWPRFATAAEVCKEQAEITGEPAITAEQPRLASPNSCKHFKPQLIEIVTLPKSMRPADHIIKEFEACPESLQEIVERIWKKYLKECFAAYKAKQRVLPTCHVHEWLRAYSYKPVNTVVTFTDLEDEGFKWKKALWWTCPGENIAGVDEHEFAGDDFDCTVCGEGICHYLHNSKDGQDA